DHHRLRPARSTLCPGQGPVRVQGTGPRRSVVAKVRVYELAKEFGVESKAVMDQLKEMGEFVRSASSTIEAPVVRRLKEAFSANPAKSAEQTVQGSRSASPAAPRDGVSAGAAAGGGRPRADASAPAATPRPPRDDRAAAAAGAPAPRIAPDQRANGSAER